MQIIPSSSSIFYLQQKSYLFFIKFLLFHSPIFNFQPQILSTISKNTNFNLTTQNLSISPCLKKNLSQLFPVLPTKTLINDVQLAYQFPDRLIKNYVPRSPQTLTQALSQFQTRLTFSLIPNQRNSLSSSSRHLPFQTTLSSLYLISQKDKLAGITPRQQLNAS